MKEKYKGKTDAKQLQDSVQSKDSNIEVLQEMLSGLKAQLKQKDIEIYRHKSRLVVMQAELDLYAA